MQTRKKVITRSMGREQANPRSSRLQKKVTALPEKKVTELITSSAKKQKSGGNHLKQTKNTELHNTDSHMSEDENYGSCFRNQTAHCDNVQVQSNEKAAKCTAETIFSPSFHHSNDVVGAIPSKEILRNEELLNHYDLDGGRSEAAVSTSPGKNEQRYIESRTADALTFACDSDRDATNVSSEVASIESNNSHLEVVGSNSANSSTDDEYVVLGNLSSEVSAIYLSIQNSKLECVDEHSQDTMSTDGCAEPDDCDDYDDFDPYLFIKDLPDLSVVVPRFRPMLLPKQTRSCPSITLVLDLDETLVHSTLEPCDDADFTFPVNFNLKEHTIYVRCRPYLQDFLRRVASMFETIIFTASQSIYAEQLLNVLDPRRKLFRHRVYRDSCVFVEGNYLKDLTILGRDLSRVVIVDNSPQAFGFQIDNGIPIESWFDNRNDQELLMLLPFLETLVGVEDVRPLIAQKFNLREKVAAAACLSIDFRN